jgi:hypothetical protein
MGGSTLRVRVHGEDALGVRPSLPCVIWRDKKAGFASDPLHDPAKVPSMIAALGDALPMQFSKTPPSNRHQPPPIRRRPRE